MVERGVAFAVMERRLVVVGGAVWVLSLCSGLQQDSDGTRGFFLPKQLKQGFSCFNNKELLVS